MLGVVVNCAGMRAICQEKPFILFLVGYILLPTSLQQSRKYSLEVQTDLKEHFMRFAKLRLIQGVFLTGTPLKSMENLG